MYADDLLLLSPSIIVLQAMLDTCSMIGSQLGIRFNSAKSKCIAIGPNKLNNRADIAGAPLLWQNKINYLGITICADTCFKVDLSEK